MKVFAFRVTALIEESIHLNLRDFYWMRVSLIKIDVEGIILMSLFSQSMHEKLSKKCPLWRLNHDNSKVGFCSCDCPLLIKTSCSKVLPPIPSAMHDIEQIFRKIARICILVFFYIPTWLNQSKIFDTLARNKWNLGLILRLEGIWSSQSWKMHFSILFYFPLNVF